MAAGAGVSWPQLARRVVMGQTVPCLLACLLENAARLVFFRGCPLDPVWARYSTGGCVLRCVQDVSDVQQSRAVLLEMFSDLLTLPSSTILAIPRSSSHSCL